MTAQELASAFENSKVGQFCKKAADAVSEFYEEHKTAINLIVGVAIIAVCAVATVATGGACGFAYAIASNALKGAIWGAVQGAIGGLVNGAVEYYEEHGTLDGSGQHLLESTAQGFVEGTISGTIDGVGTGALSYAKSPNSFCFIGGTIILTSKGYKAIEEIRIGDKVLATDPETGDTTEKTVLQTFERQTTEFVDVTIGGETYTTTPEHPFYVEGKDFVNASELEVGDKVVCYDTETDTTETKEVEEVHSYETDEPLTVYNFEVHDYHTYHVGEDGVLVHNSCKDGDFGNYKFKEGVDVDLRDQGTYKDALSMAFEKTGLSKDEFSVTKWGKDKNGKSFPVEWRANNGAEVNIDIGHSPTGMAPTVPHIGWQTGGKRGSGGAIRGHIFVNEVPYNR